MTVATTMQSWFILSLAMAGAIVSPVRIAEAQEKQVKEPDEPLPKASMVFARHVAAIGNSRARTSVTVTGTISGTGVAAGSRFERYLDSAGRYFHQTLSGGAPTSAEGWTGSAAFRTAKGVAVPLTRGRAAAVREHGVVFLGLHSAATQANAVAVEWSDFNERWHVKVRVTFAPDDARTELYDAQSGLLTLIARDRGTDADGKKQDKMVVLRGYKDFDGVKVPTDILEADGKSEWRLKVDGVRWNVAVPALLAVQRP